MQLMLFIHCPPNMYHLFQKLMVADDYKVRLGSDSRTQRLRSGVLKTAKSDFIFALISVNLKVQTKKEISTLIYYYYCYYYWCLYIFLLYINSDWQTNKQITICFAQKLHLVIGWWLPLNRVLSVVFRNRMFSLKMRILIMLCLRSIHFLHWSLNLLYWWHSHSLKYCIWHMIEMNLMLIWLGLVYIILSVLFINSFFSFICVNICMPLYMKSCLLPCPTWASQCEKCISSVFLHEQSFYQVSFKSVYNL